MQSGNVCAAAAAEDQFRFCNEKQQRIEARIGRVFLASTKYNYFESDNIIVNWITFDCDF